MEALTFVSSVPLLQGGTQRNSHFTRDKSSVWPARTVRSNHRRPSVPFFMVAEREPIPMQARTTAETSTKFRPTTERYFSIPYDDLVIRAWQQNDRDACVTLIGSVLAEYGLKWDPRAADKDVVEVEKAYRDGEFWVVEDVRTSEIVGTGAFYEVPQRGVGAVEIRKMYLRQTVRGRGLGSFLLGALEERTRQRGYSKAYVETASVLKEACILYEAKGYWPSTGIETERCDVVLERDLVPLCPSPAVQHVEAIDMTRGWTVTCCTRKQALKHRILYRAVVVLVESRGRIYVHKRSMQKSTYPGRMAAFVTGVVDWGEDPLQAAKREVVEEIGISDLEFSEPFSAFVSKRSDGLGQRIMFHPYVAKGDFEEEDVVCDPAEVECGEFMTRGEIIAKGIGGSLWTEFRAHGL